MTEKSTKLLKALRKTAQSQNTDILAAEQVNQIGERLDAPPENVICWITEWQKDGLVSLEWDGKLKLLSHKPNPTNQKNAIVSIENLTTSIITIADNTIKLMFYVALILCLLGAIPTYFWLLK